MVERDTESIDRILAVLENFKAEDINEGKGGPICNDGAGVVEQATDHNGYSDARKYYQEGGSQFLLEQMYEDFYGTIKWFK